MSALDGMPPARAGLLAEVAERYYVDGLSQDEIAKALGFSRSNISRMLKDARQHGVVNIEIRRPVPENRRLAEAVRDRWSLERVVVVERGAPGSDASALVGLATVGLVADQLRDGLICDASWGRALTAVAEHMPHTIVDGDIIQIGGDQDAHLAAGARAPATMMAERLGLRLHRIPAPLLADDAAAAALFLRQSAVTRVLDLARRANLVLVGVGAIKPSRTGHESRFDKELRQRLGKAGAVGDVCGYYFDRNGELVDEALSARIVGIGPDALRSFRSVVGVAHGTEKVAAVRGALSGRWISSLVTDESVARELLV